MVQRKVPSNICVQTDNINSEKWVGKIRPPSPRFQESKNKGADMKKIMKKSKVINRSTIESSLKFRNFIKQFPQPGKPPPDEKKKKIPNYMRSTSSFEARKEKSQVSSQVSVKSPKKDLKNSKISSCQKRAKTLTRIYSLKKVRNFTKAPSFKSTRAANKKCPKVVFCEDLNSQRATCSSTLKDSKFPNYLKLSRGATESKGTSLIKVCPYTYCSLNGHRHALLPPLKIFLSEKRHVLKTQKATKLGSLTMTPRKTVISGDREENFGKIVVDEKAAIQEPKVEEDKTDFYIEIYVENRVNDIETVSEFILEKETPEYVRNKSETELNETDSETYDLEWEEGQHPSEDEIKYNYENSSVVSGLSLDNKDTLRISCFDEISKKDEIPNLSVEIKGANSLLGNQGKNSTEQNQDEIHEDYESITNNTQAFEIDALHMGILVENILAKTENLAARHSLQQEMEEKKQNDGCESLIEMSANYMMTDGESNEISDDKLIFVENGTQNDTDINTHQAQSFETSNLIDYEDQAHSRLNKAIFEEKIISVVEEIEMSYSDISKFEESFSKEKYETEKQRKNAYICCGGRSSEDLQNNKINIQITKRQKSEKDLEREREFNPHEPNYLPIIPDPEGEKVDLRHQDLDDRKNAEEWMIDYALQKTITKLALKRKKKVILLVEAFEKVIPPSYEQIPSNFTPARLSQACR